MRRKPLKSAWANVDWSKPNAVIAASLGVTDEAVSYHRRAARGSRQNESQKNKRARGLRTRGAQALAKIIIYGKILSS